LPQPARQFFRHFAPVKRGVARADDTDAAFLQKACMASDGDKGRGVFDCGQGFGIIGLAPGDELCAEFIDSGNFIFNYALRRKREIFLSSPLRHFGNGVQRRPRRAETP